MKLKNVRVQEFRSIRDSNPFDVGDITCLVGKNESGKTSILEALYRLNPIVKGEGNFDVTDDYPRMDVEDYQHEVEKELRKPAIVTTAKFTLEESDFADIEAVFGPKVLVQPTLTLSKGYENRLIVGIQCNEDEAVKSFSSTKLGTLKAIPFCNTFEDLAEYVKTQQATPEVKEALEELEQIQEEGLVLHIYRHYLTVPKFFYFDEFYQMQGQINIESLRTRTQSANQSGLLKSDHPMLGFLDLARLSLDELITPDRTEWLINKLEGAGNHLTKQAMKYWSQNRNLEMRFEVRPGRPKDPDGMRTGTNLWSRVFDSKHRVSTPLGRRSRGFVWFFSFLAWFSKLQQQDEPLILLLDEPGLFLHAKAQGDLLRYIEAELEGHQVIYTTHSPFMVDPHCFERVRIVEDKSIESDKTLPKEEEGTKVTTDVLDVGAGTLFPLQGALGYEISQTLFVGPNSLIVEGTSDLLYIQTVSGVLHALGREALNKKWTITPVGGADKVPTFVALLGAQKDLRLATLLDIQRKDQQTIENLYKKKLLSKNRVLTFGQFVGNNEADIEDMFGTKFYLELVNAEYGTKLKESDLKSKHPRILVRLDEHFAKHPLKSGHEFSHYRPARYLAENVGTLKSSVPAEALDRFEAAFKALNALL